MGEVSSCEDVLWRLVLAEILVMMMRGWRGCRCYFLARKVWLFRCGVYITDCDCCGLVWRLVLGMIEISPIPTRNLALMSQFRIYFWSLINLELSDEA